MSSCTPLLPVSPRRMALLSETPWSSALPLGGLSPLCAFRLTFRSSRHGYAHLFPVFPRRVATRLNSNVRPPRKRSQVTTVPCPLHFDPMRTRPFPSLRADQSRLSPAARPCCGIRALCTDCAPPLCRLRAPQRARRICSIRPRARPLYQAHAAFRRATF